MSTDSLAAVVTFNQGPQAESRQARRRREQSDARVLRRVASILPDDQADPFPMTEAGDAEAFAARVAGRVLRDHQRRTWFVFGPHHWRPDPTQRVVQLALDSMRRRQARALQVSDTEARAKHLKWTLAGESEGRIRHLLDLAASHPALAIEGQEWDPDPLSLGAQNGLVNLRDGTLAPGRPEDRVTRVAAVAYDQAATCPRWDRFMLDICDDDPDLAAYLQRVVGYSITGVTTEQCFWVLFGLGSNGKSTFLETLTRHVLPAHAWTMSFPVQTWSESLSEYQRAELVGRRLIVAKESEQAKRLNTEFVKSLTGDETVNARHPYGRPFNFRPQAKFFLAANHRPIIRDETHGMWRRVKLVPFVRTFPVDAAFGESLTAEAAGILTWAVAGCLDWQRRQGLDHPGTVCEATAAYEQESDTLASFLADRCIVSDHAQVRAGALFDAYKRWCDAQQVAETDRLSLRSFGERMKRTYPPSDPKAQRVTYMGIGLRPEEDPR
jgi:putative DNA primase/helicase